MSKKENCKALLAIVLSFCMVFSLLASVILPVSAATTVALSDTNIVVVKGESYKLKITGTTKTVTWKSADTDIATVAGNEYTGKVVGVAAGQTKVKATVSGKTYSCSVTVVKKINKTYNLKKGDTLTINTSDLDAASTITYSSTDTSIAKVSSKGVVTAKGAGTAYVTATDGKQYYCAKIIVSETATTSTTSSTEETRGTGDSTDHADHAVSAEITKAATCTEDGLKTYYCSCGETSTEVIPATGHNYEQTAIIAADCTTEGSITYTCKNCGDTYKETIPMTDHTYVDHVCTYCGAEEETSSTSSFTSLFSSFFSKFSK